MLGGAILLLYALSLRALSRRALRMRSPGLWGSTLLLPLVGSVFWDTQPGRMLQATLDYNQKQTEESNGSLTAGRSDVWSHVLVIVMDYPLLGAPKGAIVNWGDEYGSFVVGTEDPEVLRRGAATHNMLLDLAVSRGIPAMIVFVIAYFVPIIDLWRRRGALLCTAFCYCTLLCYHARYDEYFNAKLEGLLGPACDDVIRYRGSSPGTGSAWAYRIALSLSYRVSGGRATTSTTLIGSRFSHDRFLPKARAACISHRNRIHQKAILKSWCK